MIRPATLQDLPPILRIYEIARKFMADNKNPSQWGKTFPPEDLLREDIEKRQLYVYTNEGVIRGVFALILGEDPTYEYIENGSFRSDSAYGTIHRLTSDGTEKGVFKKCVDYCKGQIPHLRIDTHEKNEIMQYLIQKNGFIKCGTIYGRDKNPRIAFDYLK